MVVYHRDPTDLLTEGIIEELDNDSVTVRESECIFAHELHVKCKDIVITDTQIAFLGKWCRDVEIKDGNLFAVFDWSELTAYLEERWS